MYTHSGRSERSAGPGMLLPELKLCTAGAILAPDIPLLEKIVDPDRGARWAPRAFWQIELIATAAYRARVDVGPLYDALWRAAQSLNAGQPLMAWAILGEMRGRAYPDASAALRAREAHRLIGEGQLTKDWDEAKHPRHPAGSPNSTGGQFAPKDGEEENGTLVPEEGGSGKPFDEQPPSRHRPPQGIPQVATLGEEEDGGGGETAAPTGDGSDPLIGHPGRDPLDGEPPPDEPKPHPGVALISGLLNALNSIPRLPTELFAIASQIATLMATSPVALTYFDPPKDIEDLSADTQYREFASFDEFKRYYGPAGPGYEWHHIVEQNPDNQEQFTPEQIHNSENIIRVPTLKHQEISGYYSSKPEELGGDTVRQNVSRRSLEQQRSYGETELRKRGVIK